MTGLRSLHVVSSLALTSGGPTQSVTQLCAALTALGAPAEIATVQAAGETPPPGLLTTLHTFPIASPRKLRRSPGLARFLLDEAKHFDLIHVHGLWEWPGLYARYAAQTSGKPLVISPRGMLEPWSLQQSRLLKRLALALWERRNLEHAALLHATAEMEAEHLRAFGLRNPIAVIPNGLDLPPMPAEPRPPTQKVLFLSRLHPKKGLGLLLQAWADLGSARDGWHLDIAGPDSDGHASMLASEAERLGIGDTINLLGPIYGEAKWKLLRSADLFVLPSHSENFGNVIVEALSQGVPVITTEGTPWRGLDEHRCGWWIPLGRESLGTALREAVAMPGDQLAGMGARGAHWVHNEFSSGTAAKTMLQAYSDLPRTTEKSN